MEPPTEPLPNADTNPAYIPPPAQPRKTIESAMGPFAHTVFRFTTGLRAGEVAQVRGASDEVLLTYRSFASVVGIIGALVTAIVAVSGLAAVVFLWSDSIVRAAAALALTIGFTILIALLTPRTNVTLYDGAQPALTVSQRAVFPSAAYVVAAPNGAHLADLRKSVFSRVARHRWAIVQDGRLVGEAREESLIGALLRKLLGKFSRSFETDVVVTHGGIEAARIHRRPDASGRVDVLDVTSDALDRRVIVALATLVLGAEP